MAADVSDPFERLATALGVAGAYVHAGGHEVAIPRPVRAALLAALGYPAATDADAASSLDGMRAAQAARLLPPVLVVREDAAAVRVPVNAPPGPIDAELVLESGEVRRFRAGGDGETAFLDLGSPPALGYHRLQVAAGGRDGAMRLIVVPRRCHEPPALAEGRRVWGFVADLYGVRSRRNWGHGDFSDLGALLAGARGLGADVVGLNPLHVLFGHRPWRRSPYAPNSRLFMQPLYIDVAAVPEFLASGRARELMASTERQRQVTTARAAALVDYEAVTAAKLPVLEALYLVFRDSHLVPGSDRGRAFEAFVRQGGRLLEDFGRFQALVDRLGHSDLGTWQGWPAAYRDPGSPTVAAFADAERDRVRFHQFLQWEADRQLFEAARRGTGMGIGLYRDVAVGFDRDGFDAWAFADAVPAGVSVGCPPDLRNPLGQDWGVAPFGPHALREAGYEPFIQLIRRNMAHAGGLRIDHAFQLQRLYWIPQGNRPTEGGYVDYPLDDLLGILALESRRNACLVVAEDLGTIPDGFREKAMDLHALSFRILHRERGTDRSYLPPSSYPANAVASAGTHDQATVAGFWIGRDVEVRTRLELYPTPEDAEKAPRTRAQDREKLLEALRTQVGFDGSAAEASGLPTQDFIDAVHRYLAETPSRLVVVQVEDPLGQVDQMNVPGTVDAYPNWRRRGLIEIEDLATDPRLRRLAEVFRAAGRSGTPPS